LKNDNSETEKAREIEINEGDTIEFITEPGAVAGKEKSEEKTSESREEMTQGERSQGQPEGGQETREAEADKTQEKVDPREEEIKKLKAKLQKKETELKNLRKEKEEWKDKYLRALAEMDNARKRLEREKEEFTRFALSEFLKDLLSVVDNLERALETRDETDGRPFQEGVAMIYRQLLDLLRKQGVKPIERQDNKFDPNIHQALISEEAEGIEEPEVAEVLQKGYFLHDRLLRPALVKVFVPRKNQ
jgi:molecular chaperone GrpE